MTAPDRGTSSGESTKPASVDLRAQWANRDNGDPQVTGSITAIVNNSVRDRWQATAAVRAALRGVLPALALAPVLLGTPPARLLVALFAIAAFEAGYEAVRRRGLSRGHVATASRMALPPARAMLGARITLGIALVAWAGMSSWRLQDAAYLERPLAQLMLSPGFSILVGTGLWAVVNVHHAIGYTRAHQRFMGTGNFLSTQLIRYALVPVAIGFGLVVWSLAQFPIATGPGRPLVLQWRAQDLAVVILIAGYCCAAGLLFGPGYLSLARRNRQQLFGIGSAVADFARRELHGHVKVAVDALVTEIRDPAPTGGELTIARLALNAQARVAEHEGKLDPITGGSDAPREVLLDRLLVSVGDAARWDVQHTGEGLATLGRSDSSLLQTVVLDLCRNAISAGAVAPILNLRITPPTLHQAGTVTVFVACDCGRDPTTIATRRGLAVLERSVKREGGTIRLSGGPKHSTTVEWPREPQ